MLVEMERFAALGRCALCHQTHFSALLRVAKLSREFLGGWYHHRWFCFGRKMGNDMRCMLKLLLVLLGYALISPAAAQTCCPAGCVNTFNPDRCVTTGPVQNTCAPVPCAGGSNSSGGSGGGNQNYSVFQPPPIQCFDFNPTPASRAAATDQCVAQLSGSAQFIGCLFEDERGRAEDARTGLSCSAREAILTGQCRSRCARWALAANTCISSDEAWQRAFGDIGGEHFGSARVELCGPRLRDGFAVIKRPKRPFPRVTP